MGGGDPPAREITGANSGWRPNATEYIVQLSERLFTG